jgi:hypothetical protein
MATSATGGYLSPSALGGDLNDQSLDVFLQEVVVGITGMSGTMVRPRWQTDPPNIPDFGVDWCAIGVVSPIRREPYAFALQNETGSGINTVMNSTIIRNREMDVLCSFYGPNAGANSEVLAMGLEVAQNREVMKLSGFNLVGGAGDASVVPILIKQRNLRRIDLPFTVRQQQQYTYSVLTVLGSIATLYLQDAAGNTTVDNITVNAEFTPENPITGDGTMTFTVTAQQNLSANQVVSMANDAPIPASSNNLADLGEVVGVVVGSVQAGSPVTIQYGGAVTYNGWNWGSGPVFLGLGGALTQTAPTSGFLQIIGTPLTPTTLLIQLQQPLELIT